MSRYELGGWLKDKASLKILLPVAFLAGVFSFLANFFNIIGTGAAPNPGYNNAIKYTQVVLVTLLAVPLFYASFDRRKLCGVVAIVIGAVLVVV